MGAGPAALCIVAELVEQGLSVTALASHAPDKPWPNTYGIWAEELESLGMASLLGHRWKNTISYFGKGVNNTDEVDNPIKHNLFQSSSYKSDALPRTHFCVKTINLTLPRDFFDRLCALLMRIAVFTPPVDFA